MEYIKVIKHIVSLFDKCIRIFIQSSLFSIVPFNIIKFQNIYVKNKEILYGCEFFMAEDRFDLADEVFCLSSLLKNPQESSPKASIFFMSFYCLSFTSIKCQRGLDRAYLCPGKWLYLKIFSSVFILCQQTVGFAPNDNSNIIFQNLHFSPISPISSVHPRTTPWQSVFFETLSTS